jgi:predicted  nucleic acid-binding Zn-ribbon protein
VLRTEIGKELKAAKQEIDAVKQDVNKKNQDVLDSLSRSDLANEQKFIEVNRQVAELRGQISSIASATKVSPSNASTSDVIQMQQGQSGVETTDETRACNSTSMNESMDMECLHGMNGSSLYGKVCPTTLVDVPVTNK